MHISQVHTVDCTFWILQYTFMSEHKNNPLLELYNFQIQADTSYR